MASLRPTKVVIHTLGFVGSADIDGDGDAVDDVDEWHKSNGWNGIGYHVLFRQNGEIEYGRSETTKGAHCKDMGMNSKALGAAFEGHGDHEPWTVHQTQQFLNWFKGVNERWGIEGDDILGHREAGAPKTCPGTLIDCDKVRSLATRFLTL